MCIFNGNALIINKYICMCTQNHMHNNISYCADYINIYITGAMVLDIKYMQ